MVVVEPSDDPIKALSKSVSIRRSDDDVDELVVRNFYATKLSVGNEYLLEKTVRTSTYRTINLCPLLSVPDGVVSNDSGQADQKELIVVGLAGVVLRTGRDSYQVESMVLAWEVLLGRKDRTGWNVLVGYAGTIAEVARAHDLDA